MSLIIVILFVWILWIRYISSLYERTCKNIKNVSEMFKVLQNGVCERRLSLSEIYTSVEVFKVLGEMMFSDYLTQHNSDLCLEENVIEGIRSFETEGAYLSYTRGSDVLNEICRGATKQLEGSLSCTDKRYKSMCTLITAYTMITIILVV